MVYSYYGVCLVDDISEKLIDNVKKRCYILHPFNEVNSRIMTPIDNKKVKMRAIMAQENAKEIFESISDIKTPWITDKKQRDQSYVKIIKEGNPSELAEIINALMIEDNEKKVEGKRISETDKKHLDKAERLLFPELSIALNMEIEEVKDSVASVFQL